MANNAYLIYYRKNKELVLSKAKEYYKNNKDRLSKQAREKYDGLSEEEMYRTMSEEEKSKRNEYERNRYCKMSEEQKNKKRECARNRYHTTIKTC